MFAWDSFVAFFAALLGTLAHLYGGNLGLAIITISLIARLAVLPFTLHMARHAYAQQKILLRLRDEIAKLRKRYRSDPRELAEKLAELYGRHGVKPLDVRNLAGGTAQALVGAGLYSAIRRGVASGHRFLWIRDLSQPNLPLVLLTGAITFVASVIGPHLSEQSRTVAAVLPAVLTLILAWRLSSAVLLYWASSAAMNGMQTLILRRGNK